MTTFGDPWNSSLEKPRLSFRNSQTLHRIAGRFYATPGGGEPEESAEPEHCNDESRSIPSLDAT